MIKPLNQKESRWWRWAGSNGRPAAYESAALPTELHRHAKEINGLRRRSQGRFAHCARTQKKASCCSARRRRQECRCESEAYVAVRIGILSVILSRATARAKTSHTTVSPSNSSTMLRNCCKRRWKNGVSTSIAIPHPATRRTMVMIMISLLVKGSGVSFISVVRRVDSSALGYMSKEH